MKLVFCTGQYYQHGGIEKILCQKLNYWVRMAQVEVFLITVNQKNNPFVYSVSEKVKHIDIEIDYDDHYSFYHPGNWVNLLRHYFKMKQILNKVKPDVTVSAGFSPEQYFIPFYGLNKTVKEIHFSGSILENGMTRIELAFFNSVMKKYSHLVLLNEDEKRYFKYDNISVIPNFIEDYEKGDEEAKENCIIAAGRIAPVKQFHHLIQAFAKLSREFPHWKLKIFGSGDEVILEELNDLIKAKSLTYQIDLPGSTKDLHREMRKAKIFAITSSTECFPMVLLEAKAAGLPAVSYDCPHGPRHIIIQGEDGILVENQDVNSMAGALRDLMRDEMKRSKFAKNAYKNAELFTENRVMHLWHHLFLANK